MTTNRRSAPCHRGRCCRLVTAVGGAATASGQRRRLVVSLLALLAAWPVRAQPAPDGTAGPPAAAPTQKELQARYRESLSRGRALSQKGKPREALAAFLAAVALRPQDGRALSEAGWSAFLAGELAQARSLTERAPLAAGMSPRASSLRSATGV